ncbi:MAG: acyl carrier protein [Bacillota bacterium]|nr:acyl carrier protein [Bacillota bacterium]
MILEKVKKIIVRQLHIDESLIDIDSHLMADLQADSLDAVEIIMAVEEEYGLVIPDDDAEKFRTVRDLVEYVEKQV